MDRAASVEISGHTPCAVKLEVFEGPLDLLLHLIRLNEVDVSDIPIAAISEQYLQYLEMMRELDIDVAAEYLLMAATLAHIKSRILLPPSEEEGGEEGPDPREELARRLSEYATFKEAAGSLGSRAVLGRDIFLPRPEADSIPSKEPVLDVGLFALLEALRRVLANLPPESLAHEVMRERVSMQHRMLHVMDVLREAPLGTALLEELLLDGPRIRHYVVMTFLAMLELARIQALRIFQNQDDTGRLIGPVWVRLAVEDAEVLADGEADADAG
ncbi:MAG: segregation/condensation protein A [Myxococcota bacterium]